MSTCFAWSHRTAPGKSAQKGETGIALGDLHLLTKSRHRSLQQICHVVHRVHLADLSVYKVFAELRMLEVRIIYRLLISLSLLSLLISRHLFFHPGFSFFCGNGCLSLSQILQSLLLRSHAHNGVVINGFSVLLEVCHSFLNPALPRLFLQIINVICVGLGFPLRFRDSSLRCNQLLCVSGILFNGV